nr:zinc finger, CCHC-type [Tanacetum cinerariifolium]
MGDTNPIRTLRDYSKPSHERYRNTIELPKGNNVVPLRSDTIRLVPNGCLFHRLWSEDPNQHLKDFFRLVDSLDLNGENKERTRLHLFQISIRDQASNWLERLRAGSITTWEDLTTPHAERMERFENAIFKQCEVINDKMTEMFRLLKEISASRTPENILIREEARHLITKNVNSIFVIQEEEEKDIVNNRAIIESIVEPRKSKEEEPPKRASVTNKVERRVEDEPTKSYREHHEERR